MNELPGYDAWKLAEPPHYQVDIVGKCCVCGCDVFDGEDHYEVNDDIVCDDCDFDYIRRFRKVGA